MSDSRSCPLCRASTAKVVATVSRDELARCYRDIGVSIAVDTASVSFVECATCQLIFTDPVCAGDEQLYTQLQKFDWYYLEDKPEYSMARQWISEGARVLEVGGGAGHFARFCDRGDYTGLEFNDVAIAKAQKARVRMLKESVEEHSQRCRHAYDVVLAFQVLEHVAAPSSFLRAASNCLVPGGLLIVAVPSESTLLKYAPDNPLNMPPHHVTRWTDGTLQSVTSVIDADLVALVHEPVSSFHAQWFRFIGWYQWVCKVVRRAPRLIETPYLGRTVKGIAALLTRTGDPPGGEAQWGHTVLAVYKIRPRERGSSRNSSDGDE